MDKGFIVIKSYTEDLFIVEENEKEPVTKTREEIYDLFFPLNVNKDLLDKYLNFHYPFMYKIEARQFTHISKQIDKSEPFYNALMKSVEEAKEGNLGNMFRGFGF